MRSITAITWNVLGQLLALRSPGRPSAATFDVFRNYTSDDGEPEFSGNATIDAPNTTVSASSGPSQADPQKLTLTTTAGIVVGRKYLVSENAILEWVEPIEVRATYIRVRHPLKNAFTTAATFVSTWVTAAVDATFVADLSKLSDLTDLQADYRVRWSITIGGATTIAHSFFDVVRAETRHSVDIDDINARAPGLVDSLPTEYRSEDGRPLIDAAWRALRAHFAAISIDPHSLRDDEVIDELVILRALRVLAEGGWKPKLIEHAAYLELVTSNYDRFFEQHFAVTLKHRQQEESLAFTNAVARNPFWSK